MYLFGGAYIHMSINQHIEIEERKNFEKYLTLFYDQHQCLDKLTTEKYLEILLTALDNGISFGRNTSEIIQNWKFGGETLFFAFTLVATIG